MNITKQNNKILRFYYFIPLLKTSNDTLFLFYEVCVLCQVQSSLLHSLSLPPLIHSLIHSVSAYFCVPRTVPGLKEHCEQKRRCQGSWCPAVARKVNPGVNTTGHKGKLGVQWQGAWRVGTPSHWELMKAFLEEVAGVAPVSEGKE